MKKSLSFLSLLLLLCGCENSFTSSTPMPSDDVQVRFRFQPYDIEPMSRAVTAISEYATHLDVWVYDSDDLVTEFHQSSTDDGFGTVAATLNSTKTYQVYAAAHRCASNATLTADLLSFPDDKLTHSFFTTYEVTPVKGTTYNVTMPSIVAQLQFTTTDAVPADVKAFRFTIYNIFDRWDVLSGGTHNLDRVTTFDSFSKKQDNTVTFNLYAIVTDTSTPHDVLVEALDENGDEVESHLFEDVPLRNGYRTIASGAFFTNAAASFVFKADEWSGTIDYDF